MRREAGYDEDHPTIEVQLLRYIGYQTALTAWLQTDTKKSQAPKPIELPGDTKARNTRRKDGRHYDEVMRERLQVRAAQLARISKQDKGTS
jgi:hypothetical protein